MFRPPVEVRRKKLDDRYEVGSDGVVYSGGLPLEPIAGVGVNIHGKRMKIAYLVARAFVPNQEGRPFVRHINGDPKDNNASNLEWSETQESRKRGPKPQTRYCSAFTKEGVRMGVFRNPSEGAEELNVNVRLVRKCLAGKSRTAGGYLWRWGA